MKFGVNRCGTQAHKKQNTSNTAQRDRIEEKRELPIRLWCRHYLLPSGINMLHSRSIFRSEPIATYSSGKVVQSKSWKRLDAEQQTTEIGSRNDPVRSRQHIRRNQFIPEPFAPNATLRDQSTEQQECRQSKHPSYGGHKYFPTDCHSCKLSWRYLDIQQTDWGIFQIRGVI